MSYGYTADERPAVTMEQVLMAAVVHLPTGTLSAGTPVYNRGCILLGWVIRERAGSPALAQADLLDGGNSGGELIAPWSIAGSAQISQWCGLPGIQVKSGLYLNVLAGTLGGTLFIIPGQ